MPRTGPIPLFLAFTLLCLSPAGAATHGASRVNLSPEPTHRIPLDKLGFRAPVSAMWQQQNFTMQTVEYVDDAHVLVTWNARKLIPRLPDESDHPVVRLVHAAVLHLPDGRVVHESEWRTHDRGRYLWPLGHGEFLLRLRESLYLLTPLRGKEGFERALLLDTHAEIVAVQVSPEGEMILVETLPEKKVGDDDKAALPPGSITGVFYTLRHEPLPVLQQRLALHEDRPFRTAFTSRGFLTTLKEDRSHWGFDFHPNKGKPLELAGFVSTCEPHVDFLSSSTFLATGCRGADDRRLLAGFNFSAEASWVFTTDDAPIWQAISTAPAAGRFALRTTNLDSADVRDDGSITPEHVKVQQVHVYAFHDGIELLRVPLTPPQRPGESFAMSPDGLALAVLHGNELYTYTLPPRSADEEKDLSREAGILNSIAPAPEGKIEQIPQRREEK